MKRIVAFLLSVTFVLSLGFACFAEVIFQDDFSGKLEDNWEIIGPINGNSVRIANGRLELQGDVGQEFFGVRTLKTFDITKPTTFSIDLTYNSGVDSFHSEIKFWIVDGTYDGIENPWFGIPFLRLCLTLDPQESRMHVIRAKDGAAETVAEFGEQGMAGEPFKIELTIDATMYSLKYNGELIDEFEHFIEFPDPSKVRVYITGWDMQKEDVNWADNLVVTQ